MCECMGRTRKIIVRGSYCYVLLSIECGRKMCLEHEFKDEE